MSPPNILGIRTFVRKYTAEEDRGHTSPCWIWQRCLKADGYAVAKFPGYKMVRVSRAAYEAFVGPIPDGLEIDHLCQVRSCCNPDHLEPVTHAENMARQVALRTTCRRGHPFEDDNLYIFPNGDRACRVLRERARPPRARKAAA